MSFHTQNPIIHLQTTNEDIQTAEIFPSIKIPKLSLKDQKLLQKELNRACVIYEKERKTHWFSLIK